MIFTSGQPHQSVSISVALVSSVLHGKAEIASETVECAKLLQ